MIHFPPKVKYPTTGHRLFVVMWVKHCRSYMDQHPRVGWYIAMIATLNTFLEILNLLHG